MRTPEEVALVDELLASGLNDCQIARRTGIPRRTVMDWRVGRRPNFKQHRLVARPRPDCHQAYAYLFGLYLGDGCISRAPRVYRLRIALDGIYPEIVEECRVAMSKVLPNRVLVQRTASRAMEVNAYSKSWPHLFPQHGPGPKHLRRIFLADWQREITHRYPKLFIRGLIHSDGCRSTNSVRVKGKLYRYPRYQFTNHSDDIRAIFCEHLDLLGIPWRRMNRWNISVARREGVARLDEFVGPKR